MDPRPWLDFFDVVFAFHEIQLLSVFFSEILRLWQRMWMNLVLKYVVVLLYHKKFRGVKVDLLKVKRNLGDANNDFGEWGTVAIFYKSLNCYEVI